jgi:hypothetical protein
MIGRQVLRRGLNTESECDAEGSKDGAEIHTVLDL